MFAGRQVEAWRVRGRVPLAVDSTANLREAQLLDQQGTVSEQIVRSQYCLSLIRLVNGISDSSQRGKTASSVATLATAAGVPRFLVDMRHEAAHNELPSLEAAREGAAAALEWLQTCYWRRQADHLAASGARLRALVEALAAACAGAEGAKPPAIALGALRSFVLLGRARPEPPCLPEPLVDFLRALRGEWDTLGGLLLRAALADGLEAAAAKLGVDAWRALLEQLVAACEVRAPQALDVLDRVALAACCDAWTRRAPARAHCVALCRALAGALDEQRDRDWVDRALAAMLEAPAGPAPDGAEAQADAAQARARWVRASPAEWAPCALGALPSRLDANGAAPCLRLEEPRVFGRPTS
ncbi:hypothetical protein QBZ16_004454 [Prototheca wickerhamii]|uniref:Uncharacterized protein n=1 Tax=Prototheca wickerhamii TaxID=3111 RepID=A0AAD9MGW2_PROWI|nr:hypothetical protein QBZ16_004454 [Prototheca wickerhamii]